MDRALREQAETLVDHWLHDLREHRGLLQGDRNDLRGLVVNQKMDDLMKMDDLNGSAFSLRSSLLLHFLTYM
jgi:hypothetical protein